MVTKILTGAKIYNFAYIPDVEDPNVCSLFRRSFDLKLSPQLALLIAELGVKGINDFISLMQL